MLTLQSLDRKFNKIFIRKKGNENFIRQNSNSQIKRSRYYLEHSLQLFLLNTFTPHCYLILGGEVTRAVINVMTLHFIIENFRNVENSKTQMLCNDNRYKQLWKNKRHKLLWNIKRHLLVYHFQHGSHAL